MNILTSCTGNAKVFGFEDGTSEEEDIQSLSF